MIPVAFFLVCALILPFVSPFAIFPMNEKFYSSKTLEEFALGSDSIGYRRLILDKIPSVETTACMETLGENTTECLEGIEQHVENVESAIKVMLQCLSPSFYYHRTNDTCPFDTNAALFIQEDDLWHAKLLLRRCEQAAVHATSKLRVKQWNDTARPNVVQEIIRSHSGIVWFISSILLATYVNENHDLLGMFLIALFVLWVWLMVHMVWLQLALSLYGFDPEETPSLAPLEATWNDVASSSLDVDNLVKPWETSDSQPARVIFVLLQQHGAISGFTTLCLPFWLGVCIIHGDTYLLPLRLLAYHFSMRYRDTSLRGRYRYS